MLFKNGSEFLAASYGSVISFTASTAKVTIKEYGAVDLTDYEEVKIYLRAKTNFMISDSIHALTLNVKETFNILPPPSGPKFEKPLPSISLDYKYDFVTQPKDPRAFEKVIYYFEKPVDGIWAKNISVDVQIDAANTETPGLLKYYPDTMRLVIDPNLVTEALLAKKEITLVVETNNEYQLKV